MISRSPPRDPAQSEFPEPRLARWQPLRGGLLNLYRYDAQEFRYEQGRMLLRGNNGTGKSRVLALQLPFLLDGEVAPHRLEPDGDPAKRIEWNLLMGRHRDRLGYTWLEFGRLDSDGTARFVTLGCGLSAVEGKGLTGRWFFVTTRRVGVDLFLQSAAGHPLSRDRLEEVLDPDREVFRTATSYRRAVDDALFRLGERRYEALVALLIQLRQPQLSRKLDEAQLSVALSDALPPLPDSVVADVADAFRSLETDRAALDAFTAAGRAVEAFLTDYRGYAQVAARRRAAGVRTAHSSYEETGRRLRAAEHDLEAAQSDVETLAHTSDELSAKEAAARAAENALAASPEMASVRELERVRRDADEKGRAAAGAADDVERTTASARSAEERRKCAEIQTHDTREAVVRLADATTTAADEAAIAADHARAVAPLDLPGGPDEPAFLDAARTAAEKAVSRKIQAVRRLRELNQRLAAARSDLASAKSAQAEVAGQLDTARESERAAHERLVSTVETLVADYRTWAARVRELEPAEADTFCDAAREWDYAGAGESPVAAAVRGAATAAEQRLAAAGAELAQQREAAARDVDTLVEERSQLTAGRHRLPPPPHTRDLAARETRAGAPLWLLCDFRGEVGPAARAGLEAALEASGILDAWVTPDGRLLARGAQDSVLAIGTSPEVPDGGNLGTVLVPSIDRGDPRTAALDEATVAAVLRHVGARSGVGSVWVDPDGTWQLGPLHGAWMKPASEHVGQASREAARRRRLDELERAIGDGSGRLASIDAAIRGVDERRHMARSEAESAPGDGGVRGARATVDVTSGAADDLRQRVVAAEERVLARRRDVDAAVAVRDTDARDLGVAPWAESPDRLDELVHAYHRRASELWPAIRSHVAARRALHDAASLADEARAEERRRASLLETARLAAEAVAAERDVLESSVGRTEQEILRRLAEAKRGAEGFRDRIKACADERLRASKRLGEVEGSLGRLRETLDGDTARRDAAIRSFAAFVGTKLLATAVSSLAEVDPSAWSDTRAVDVARRTEDALGAVESDDAAWERTQKEIHRHVEALKDSLLPHGYSPVTTIADDVFVVEVPFHGRTCTMTELREAISGEIRERRMLLDAREREVLENYLVGEASLQLHELLRRGEELVHAMNAELGRCPTSTGMKLRFSWEPVAEGPPGLAQARQQLLRAGATWSPAERQALGEFLQARIREIRRDRVEGTWPQHLAEALDYRAWHTFSIERFQDGHWRRLTRRTHGTGSGGEKAVALTVPQFAAAAAHYRSADMHAPRLILLDEAFVGIDGDMRAKCMGLLAAFDLDFVMTSEREWGCYATVPGVAIYQLAAVPGIDAVGVTRWVWNGRERLRDELVPPGVRAPADGPRHDEAQSVRAAPGAPGSADTTPRGSDAQ